MYQTVQIALFGVIPLALLLAAALPARAAILASLVIGWLFLPVESLQVVGIPDYDKIVATNLAATLGCLLFHRGPLLALRPRWVDLPLVLWCFAPAFSSLSNDLGWYDAASVGFRQGLTWALPYALGRAYFNTPGAMRDLAIAVVIGGLVYIPFCLLEVRISPQLNAMVYGFHQNQFWRNLRFDGYRPVVFMQSGLMVGTWMATSTVIACWLWATGTRRLLTLPAYVVCGALLTTTVLCKALYAILLMIAALGLLLTMRVTRMRWPLVLLLLSVPVYMVGRSTDVLQIEAMTNPAARLFGEDRAQSLQARLLQEGELVQHVSTRPLFGWGGWKRSWPLDPDTGEYVLRGIDGLWTIVLGENGLFGLAAMFAVLLLPVAIVLARHPTATLNREANAAATAMMVSLLLFACDCLLNGMFNPIYLVVAGGLSTMTLSGSTRPAVAEPASPSSIPTPPRLAWPPRRSPV